ncbi:MULTISPECIES: ABC transporter permease subunit [unclassified Brenneria]|uniref:ABC transporter permease subunit n=1 Tax=unclassified Brenneria TaxID=2634434 RepID=UPI0029C4C631|nr:MULTISPECIES: ABC transporter permease subunit [unclassified Brenneria]MDX5629748.1 ABC transporter permease subunit [Brenneria sp. L3-3Z]MDX5696894.1 ABC transporter permease subunit [Brenneria sp. L4-2C]MEE3663308.1 ABC transporter permease subunit [Brenneria sp. g21c3]
MNLPSEPAVAAATLGENTIRSPWRDFIQVFIHNPMALISGGFILLLVLVAVFAPWLAPWDPMEPDWMALSAPPSAAHWMGTDDLGRDVMSRIIYGARISLYIGTFSVTLGMLAGIVLGLLAGYYGRWIDMLIMRGSDVLFAFPGMLLAIAVVAILGPGLNNVIIAVAIFSVPVFARIVRASTLTLKQAAYVEAVRCAGAPNRIVLMRHILPGTLPSVIVYFTMRIGTSILTAASLSFIGLGPEPDVPEWGNILAMSRSLMMAGLWHVSVFPGLAIFFTVLAFNLLGDALRDTLDPKLKS